MINFNGYITEEIEKRGVTEVAVLALDADEGTAADIISNVCEFNDVKCTIIHTNKAFLADSDVELRKVEIHNIDGEGKLISLDIDNTIVFVRAGAVGTLVGQALVSSLQTAGFFLINDLESMMLCNNKMATSIALQRNNVQIPKTVILNNEESIDLAVKSVGGKYPLIVKTLTGTQGIGVSKIESYDSLISVCQTLWKFEAQLLLQEYLEMKSDIRTLVINGHIMASAERRQTKKSKDFRKNVHRGAEAIPYKLSEEEVEVILNAARATGAYYCGVDHTVVNGEIYVVEVNGSPGAKSHFMGYDLETNKPTKPLTAEKAIDLMIKHILEPYNRKTWFRQEAGYIETVYIEGYKLPVRAKFDTGNGTDASMLHVDKIEIKNDKVYWEKNGQKFVNKYLGKSVAVRGPTTRIERAKVELTIKFNGRSYNAFVGLTEEDSASEMLVNRELMTLMRIAINPSLRFGISDWTRKNDETDV